MVDFTSQQILLIFAFIWGALIASGFWEAYVEGRNAWGENKLGWKLNLGPLGSITGYHFCLFGLMYPFLLALPLIITGWNLKLFGIIVSAYSIGLILEDFTWYLVNPVVKLEEWLTPFSDYYPWVRIGRHKIVPAGYLAGVAVSLLAWFFLWR